MNFTDKTGVLAQLWFEFREDEQFSAFMKYNDIGTPMAYFIAEGLVNPTSLGEQYIEETIDMMFKLLDITEEEIDELDEVNLNAILTFASDKKHSTEGNSLMGRDEIMPQKPKATPLPIEYTEDGEEITVAITCHTCGFVSFNEVYDICPKCLKTVNYIPPKSDED